MDAEVHDHAFLKVGGRIADDIRGDLDLVECFLIHEMEAVTILVEIAEFVVFNVGALDLVRCLVTLGGLHAIRNPAHIDLGRRRALAWMKIFCGKNDIKFAVDVHDIALAER